MDIDGFNSINLTKSPLKNDTHPQFSPDGLQVVFTSTQEDNSEIYIMELEWYGGYTRYKGINQINLSNNPAQDGEPHFSPIGSRIIFESFRDGNYEIYSVSTDASNLINLSNNPHHDRIPYYSPDGQSIVFWSNRDGNDEIYIMDSDGNNQTRLTINDSQDIKPKFLQLGDKIVF